MQNQDPSFKKFIDSLKENNRTLKTISDNTDSQKRKEERKTLEEIVSQNKKDLGLQLTQTKLEQDIVNDEDKGDELLQDIKDILADIKDSFKQTSGSGASIAGKSSDSQPVSGRLGNLDWTDRSFGEDVRTAVAGVKGIGGKVKSGFGAALSAVKNPGAAIKSAVGTAKDIGKGIVTSAKAGVENLKDIAATPADYDAERERFNTAFEKSDVAESYRPRDEKGRYVSYKEKGKGRVAYDLTKANQDKIEGVQARIDEQKAMGFGANKADTAELEKQTKRLGQVDPRQAKQKAVTAVNPNADNIESSGEKLNKEIADNNVTLGKLLSVTQEQLTNVKAIKDAIASSTSKEVESKPAEQKAAEAAPAAAEESGPSLPSVDINIGGGRAGKAGKGIGGKILGGLGKAAKVLGPAAAVAGAAYSGFEGYQNTGSNFDLKEGEQATTGQKISSTLGGVASGLTFGLLDEKTAAQGLHKAGSAVGSFFGMGDKKEAVTPSATPPTVGNEVAKTSTENTDLSRTAASGGQSGMVVSNNVTSTSTTKYVPIRSSVRPENQGSALDRYQNRTAVY